MKFDVASGHADGGRVSPGPPDHPAVACERLVKAYGAVRAVDGVSFTARRGEIVALLGPSGCGKTTTLRLVAGLEAPDGGSIAIDGATVSGPGVWVAPERRRVSMVFQHYALFPHMTVAENVGYGLDRAPDRATRVAELLAMVGLGALAGRMPHELSGGQQQRVALARALAPRPAILLLDEPFSNLDARLRLMVREEVRDILKATGTTAIFVTHDQEEALFIGDRVAVLSGGRLEQIDSPEGIYHAPATRFVAEFMGQTRFLAGRAVAGGIETELGTIPQPLAVPPGTAVDVLVRPDDLALAAVAGRLELAVGRPTPAAQANGREDIELVSGPLGLGGPPGPAGPPDVAHPPAVADPPGAAAAGVLGQVNRRTFQGMHNLYRVTLPSGCAVDCLAPHTLVLAAGTPVRVAIAPGHALRCFVDGQSIDQESGGPP